MEDNVGFEQDEEDLEHDTGPFCRHYSDPSDCELDCVACGCRCPFHDYANGECMDCDCRHYVDPEENEI